MRHLSVKRLEQPHSMKIMFDHVLIDVSECPSTCMVNLISDCMAVRQCCFIERTQEFGLLLIFVFVEDVE